jgi:cell division protein FtsL
MASFLEKIQKKPESERRIIFWALVIIFGVLFFGGWLLALKENLKSINQDKLRQELRVEDLEKQLKELPKVELPKIDETQLKDLEKLLGEEPVNQ